MLIEPSRLSDDVRKIYPNGVDPHREYKVSNDGIIFEEFVDGIITVDKLLAHADLNLSWYLPSVDAINFFNFIRLVLGEEPENNNPRSHYFFIDSLFHSPNVKPFYMARNIDFDDLDSETVVLCSREFAKSVLITFLILFLAVEGKMPGFGKINYGLYVSDSMRNGVKKMMLRLRGIYNESQYLNDIFEEVNITQEDAIFVRNPRSKREVALYNDFVNKQQKSPTQVPGRMKRTFKIDGLGAATSSRGASNVLTRPQCVFIDDVVANEVDASSVVILESIESTIEADIRGGLSGSGYFMVAIGTPYNKSDPIYRRVEEGLMLPVVFPRAVKPPYNDLKKEDFESVWPDRHTYKNCRREYKNALKSENNGNKFKMRKLMQEHYLQIANEEDRLVPESLLQWYNSIDITSNAFKYNWYITSDFTSTGSKGSDLSAIALWAVDSSGNFFLVDLSARQLELEEQYNETFNMVEMVLPNVRWVEVGVETDGQQNIHIYALKQKMSQRGTFFTFARQKGSKIGSEGIKSRLEGGNKHWRFRQMLPMFQNHKIWFPNELKDTPSMKEMLEEIKYTTYTNITSKRDDCIDVLSMINAMEVIYPSKEYAGEPKKQVGMKNSRTNAKIWKRNTHDDDNETAFDSYI